MQEVEDVDREITTLEAKVAPPLTFPVHVRRSCATRSRPFFSPRIRKSPLSMRRRKYDTHSTVMQAGVANTEGQAALVSIRMALGKVSDILAQYFC